METIIEWFFGLVGVALFGFVLLIFITFGYDFFLTMNNGNGWISQDRKGEAFTEILKEENGCIYYINVYGSSAKTCGSYNVKTYHQ